MKYYGLICNGGDGSVYISWYTKEEADERLNGDDYETYGMNEEEYAAVITVPEGMELKDVVV